MTTSFTGAGRLCDRVVAPELPDLTHPAVALWRAATLDDVDAITAAQKAMDLADHPDWTTPREDIVDELDSAHLSLSRDTVVGVAADGAVIAWGAVEMVPSHVERVSVMPIGGVVPTHRRRGIGALLLDWQIARATQQIAGLEETLPAWIRFDAAERNPGAIALLEGRGLRVVRYFTSMERIVVGEAAPEIPFRPVPDDVRLVPYTPDRAEDARLARNDSFRDHWGSRPTLPESWEQFVGSTLFRNDLSWLALDTDGRILGFALVNANPEDWELQGFTSSYLGILGVIREARGRGIAPLLLTAALSSTREAGLERVVLDVDTENPSGALGMYEGVGFFPTNRSVDYVADIG